MRSEGETLLAALQKYRGVQHVHSGARGRVPLTPTYVDSMNIVRTQWALREHSKALAKVLRKQRNHTLFPYWQMQGPPQAFGTPALSPC